MADATFTDHPFAATIPADRATWDAERNRLAGESNPAAWSAAAKTLGGPGLLSRPDTNPGLSARIFGSQTIRAAGPSSGGPLARDRAMGRLLFYSGVRLCELVGLDEDDVPLSAGKGKVIVRAGKGGDWREIPLMDPSARTAVAEWKAERPGWGPDTPALFVNRRGGRLCARAAALLVDELATDADLVDDNGKPAASARTIRHTFGTNLVRDGTDLVVVAELMGHHWLETTRLYTLPTEADVEAAVARLPADH